MWNIKQIEHTQKREWNGGYRGLWWGIGEMLFKGTYFQLIDK